LFQLNETITAFFAAEGDSHRIVTLDWTTLQYTRQDAQLSGDRRTSACALLKGENGQQLVAVAGGPSPGMEVWNPQDGTVQTVSEDFPSGTGYGRQMVAVKGGSELIFYEFDMPAPYAKVIYKYSQLSNTWTQIGEMILARNQFVVLPVDGIVCP
jgi:hypothetical protein